MWVTPRLKEGAHFDSMYKTEVWLSEVIQYVMGCRLEGLSILLGTSACNSRGAALAPAAMHRRLAAGGLATRRQWPAAGCPTRSQMRHGPFSGGI